MLTNAVSKGNGRQCQARSKSGGATSPMRLVAQPPHPLVGGWIIIKMRGIVRNSKIYKGE
jgi:hypothetical protein